MMIPHDDRGFTLGDGLFETVLADHGRLDMWERHVDRLQAGCVALGLPVPQDPELAKAASAAIEQADLGAARAAVRLSWTAGRGGRGLDRPAAPLPQLIAHAAAAPLTTSPAQVVIASVRRNETSPASRLKTLSYLDQVLARREATSKGADDALMLNTAGELACASAANLFWIADGVLYTPAIACGVLPGIMRQRVMERASMETVQVRAAPSALQSASAVFLTNSLIGIREVSMIDGRSIGRSDVTRQLAAAIF